MKTFAALTFLALSGAIAAPAFAQPYDHRGWDHHPRYDEGGPPRESWDLDRRMNWLQEHINQNRDRGLLSRREYREVRNELDAIRSQAQRARYGHGYMSPRERQTLEARLDRLTDRVRYLSHNDNFQRPW